MIRIAILLSALSILFAPPLAAAENGNGSEGQAAPTDIAVVEMDTTMGKIVLELDAEKAPISVANFLNYAQDGFYDGTIFHRVISGFMIQGGGFDAEMEKKVEGMRPMIKNEWRNGLKNTRGTIAMARLGGNADSASSQFFINHRNNASLDMPQPSDGAGYAVFGKVIEGMDVVDAIAEVEKVDHPKYPSNTPVVPAEPVIINSVKVTNGFSLQRLEAQLLAIEQANKAAKEQYMRDRIAEAEKESGTEAVTTDDGLTYVILNPGREDGKQPAVTDRVKIHTRGTFTDGEVFYDTYADNAPATFNLNQLIKGWQLGIPLIREGGKVLLVCPPDLAYGQGRPGIPPNSTLIFEVELLEVQ